MAKKQSNPERSTPQGFPIVGVGASAGGFDALRRLLEAMPEKPGVALVVIQHLARDRPSLAAELLDKYTVMKVRQVTMNRSCCRIMSTSSPPGSIWASSVVA